MVDPTGTCPFRHSETLPETPARVRMLPVDERGYPIPFFVLVENGKANFSMADRQKFRACVSSDLCWICGQRLGRHRFFVFGPSRAIERVAAEPPMHRDCAEFSAKACPFLVNPRSRRCQAATSAVENELGGVSMLRHPGAFAIWGLEHDGYALGRDRAGTAVFRIGAPTLGVQWFTNGAPASRTEVVESIRAALPGLVQRAMEDGDAELKLLSQSLAMTEMHVPDGFAGCLVGLVGVTHGTPESDGLEAEAGPA